MSNIDFCDIDDWVDEAEGAKDREFREAVHITLSAIASDEALKASMVLKGGILLAIRYQSHRYTRDIDFSTDKKIGAGIDVETIRNTLNNSLAQMVEEYDYDLDCRVQSCKVQPNRPDATFPSIKLTIGYAYKGTPKHRRLLALDSATTLSIDYSLNESLLNIEKISLKDGEELLAYAITDLVAEKYRSLLQQPLRNRNRRQDVFDLSILIDKFGDAADLDKSEILRCLIIKSRSRDIDPTAASIDNPEIRQRAEVDYLSLADEVKGELPDFGEIFVQITEFYKSLPWVEVGQAT